MIGKTWAAAATCFVLALSLESTSAAAFCGVVEKWATSYSGQRAANRALRNLNREIRKLKAEHGSKLVVDEVQQTCTGGALAIDASGNETVGKSRCTATVGYCVNP